MQILPHSHLLTLTLDVAFGAMTTIGVTPAGVRRIAPVTCGQFNGPKLQGKVIGGADWVINRPDAVMEVDVRLTLQTDDGASIYLAYKGRFLAPAEAMTRFARGIQLDPAEYALTVVANIECGDPRYNWLNDTIAVGVGRQQSTGVTYEFFAIG